MRPTTRLWLLAIGAALIFSSLETQAANPRVKEVVVVFKTHFDIGYTDLVTNVLTRYRTSFLDGALKLIEDSRQLPADQQFVWTVPGWPLRQMLWPGQTPERRAKVLQALRDGRLAVHAMPFTLQTESLDIEDLVRGLRFSADLARENGLPLPRAAKMTDVPEHCWVLPTLLKHAGIDFLHLGCNGGSTPMHVPPLFWWEGPDGSRLLTAYSIHYGTELLPPKDWPYQTWLAMIMTGDNHGPPSAAEVDKLLRQAASELPGVKIKFGRLEDFYDAISAERNQHIPVVRGDMPDTWIHGFEAMPAETKLAWDARPLEGAVGALDTELRVAGVDPPPLDPSLSEAYEKSLLYSEHTFGYRGSQPGGFWYGDEWARARAEGKYARFERSFEDKRDYIRGTASLVTNALDARLRLLAQNVATDGFRVCVFNPLPWKRSGEVEIALPEGKSAVLQDLATGRRVTVQDSDGPTVRFLAEDVPSLGYKTFGLLPSDRVGAAQGSRDGTGSSVVLKNKTFRLEVDPARGCITSLRDLKTGRELVAPEPGVGQYLHERFSSNNVQAFISAYCRRIGWVNNDFGKPGMPGPDKAPYARITLTNWTVTLRQDPVAKTVTLRCPDATPLAKAVTIRYTLYEAQPYLDLEWAIEDKTPNPLPEGGWLCLPFAIERPEFKLARLGSLTDPSKDIIEGANRHLFCLNSGMTITGPDGYGVGLCPLDSPLVSLGEPGLWKFSLNYVPLSARVFINLYNNQWDTNFPLWQEGSWNSRVRLWLVRKGISARNLIEPAWEARASLLASSADGPRGNLPVQGSGLSVSREGVIATCFGPDPYSDKLLLRLWELGGVSGALTVTLPPGLKATRALPVNLRGVPEGKPVRISRGTFKINLPAFAPASFVLDAA
ncbi:MAG TPA: hypothetical protein VN578_25190 [Candidatus Binatia bacterium]|jgi:alpha-mannosidase|nr:hypothetical protein [Candidatus Binatia bacterium]